MASSTQPAATDDNTSTQRAEISSALRSVYQAISEVTRSVSGLPIPDEDLHPLLEKMDHLQEAFGVLRRLHLQNDASVSSPVQTRERKELNEAVKLSGAISKKQASSLESKFLILEEKLESIYAEIKTDIKTLKGDCESRSAAAFLLTSDQKEDVTAVTRTTNTLSSEQKDISKRLTISEEKVNSLNLLQKLLNDKHLSVQTREELSSQVQGIKNDVASLSENVDVLHAILMGENIDQGKQLVAFYVKAERSLRFYQPGDTIKFVDVIENTFDCYNIITSTFTAPKDGLYFLASSINVNTARFFTAAITVNGNENLAYFGTPPTADLQSSTSALKSLTKGDKVCIKIYSSSSSDGIEPGSGFSNFMGFSIR